MQVRLFTSQRCRCSPWPPGSSPAPSQAPDTKPGLRMCALWMAPLLFLTFSHYRDVRYAAPLYPALALALAILADRVLRRWGAKAGACVAVLLLLPLLSLLQVSFGVLVGPAGAPFELGGLLMPSPYLSYARRFDRTLGPQEAILLDLYHRFKFSGGERKMVLVGTDQVRFNADNFKLAAAQRKLPFDIETTAFAADQSALLPFLGAAAFFVYKEGGARETTFFNGQGGAAARLVRESGRFHEILPPHTLPDGGVVRVFENLSHGSFLRSGAFLPEGMVEIPAARAIFGDQLQLIGFSVRRTPEGLEVQFRIWIIRCSTASRPSPSGNPATPASSAWCCGSRAMRPMISGYGSACMILHPGPHPARGCPSTPAVFRWWRMAPRYK